MACHQENAQAAEQPAKTVTMVRRIYTKVSTHITYTAVIVRDFCWISCRTKNNKSDAGTVTDTLQSYEMCIYGAEHPGMNALAPTFASIPREGGHGDGRVSQVGRNVLQVRGRVAPCQRLVMLQKRQVTCRRVMPDCLSHTWHCGWKVTPHCLSPTWHCVRRPP